MRTDAEAGVGGVPRRGAGATRFRSRRTASGGASLDGAPSAPVALLVLQARSAVAGVVASDPLAGRGEPGTRPVGCGGAPPGRAVERLVAERFVNAANRRSRG